MIMQKNLGAILPVVCAVAVTILSVGNADAIPAFARQNKAECTTCHTIFPELNEYGEAFYKNVYVLTHDKTATKAKEQPKDPKLEGLILSGIPLYFPGTITATMNLAYDKGALNNDKLDLSSRAIQFQAGGNFNEDAGLFISYNLYTQGIYEPKTSNVPLNNTPNLNEAFVVWRHAFDTPINLKAGRMKPKLSLWKSTNNTAVTSYAPLVYKVGNSPFSVDSPEDALELNAVVANRVFVAAGVVDRNGQNTKEGYGHVSVKLGGADFNGTEPTVDFDNPTIWNYTSLTLGAYSYFGRVASVSNQVAVNSSNFYRAGIDADFNIERFRGRLSAVKGKDSNPYLDSTIDPSSNVISPVDVESVVFAAEGQYLFGSKVLAAFRYEFQDAGPIKFFNNNANALAITWGTTHRYIPSIAYAPKQSIKVVLEYKREETPLGSNNVTNLGAVVSF